MRGFRERARGFAHYALGSVACSSRQWYFLSRLPTSPSRPYSVILRLHASLYANYFSSVLPVCSQSRRDDRATKERLSSYSDSTSVRTPSLARHALHKPDVFSGSRASGCPLLKPQIYTALGIPSEHLLKFPSFSMVLDPPIPSLRDPRSSYPQP